MAYKVDKFNGAFLVNVRDGTIDTTTDIRFVGKNYAGYGEVQNENFLHLMENFAGTTPPPKAIDGQVWYDSANKKLKFYDGNKFKIANGAESAAIAPGGMAVGEFWWDTTAQQLYTWSGTDFILVGPEASPELGSSAVQTLVVKDNVTPIPNNHTIVQLISAGKVMSIVSRTAFTLNPTINPIEGFTAIKKGVTLVNTNALGESSDDHFFWGTASDANRLGQRPASDYLLKTDLSFTAPVNFKDPGFQVGDDNDLRISIEDNDNVIVENRLGNEITFRITVTPTTDERDVGVFDSTGFRPGVGSIYDLGTSSAEWNNVHAVTVNGNLIGNVTGNSTGIHQGDVIAFDSTEMVNSTTKQFFGQLGTPQNAQLMYGSLIGNCQGTATTANNLREFSPSITLLFQEDGVTLQADQRSVPIRDTSGDIFVRRVIGTADKADQLLVGASYRSTALTPTGNTIAARDNNGDIFARLFQGTATVAQTADTATTSTRLQTARTIRLINGVTGEATFDGSGNIDINCTVVGGGSNNTTIPTNLGITPGSTAGPTVTSSSGTGATLPTASATASGVVTTGAQTWAGAKTFADTISGSITGNATTATRLQTARTFNGILFDGSANITVPTNLGIIQGSSAGPVVTSSSGISATIPTASASISGVVTTGAQTWAGAKTFADTISGSITGNATTATRLQTARRIRLTNGVTGEANFDGSGNIDISCTVVGGGGGGGVTSFSAGTTGLTPSTATSGAVTLAGTLGVSNGGTGVTTSTGAGNVVLSTGPTLISPNLGTPTSVNLSNGSSLPIVGGTAGTLSVVRGGTGVTTSTGTGSTVLNASPVLIGVPIAPTADVSSNSTQIATTAFVKTAAVTLAGSQTITGAKTFTGAFGITEANPGPTIWSAYSKSKLNSHPAFVFDGGSGSQPICSNFFGGTVGSGNTVLFTFFAYGPSNNNVGSIGCSDGVNTAFTTTSDYRLKENIQPMADALTKVAQLKPVTYTWKTTGQVDEGFIAHELKEVIPSAVLGQKDELNSDGSPRYQSIDTSFIVATLTAAIQELKAELDVVKAELNILKGN